MRSITIDVNHITKTKFPVVACIGYFDGMHLGHQALIQRTVEMAEELGCESALITFEPDPWVTIKDLPLDEVEHITTLRQRINLAVKYGIENIFTLKFSKEMSSLNPEDFLEKVMGQINLKGLVCGFDFHFGAMGKGDTAYLLEHCSFPISVVEAVCDEQGKISSTRISKLLEDGEIEEASRLLGHTFVMEGKVIPGRHKGTGIGYPTANIQCSVEYLKLKTGVYACYAYVGGKKYKAMVNIGHNPTMNYTNQLSTEVHIFDFNHNIYGVNISIEFVKWIRPEVKFRNIDNLVMQLEQDERVIRNLLNNE